ncbi:MAG: hypothetical protein GWP09_02985 [Nitrospiraceae bacterium]|nr:hypothetical protein [Nitrospiraceae bacterium]
MEAKKILIKYDKNKHSLEGIYYELCLDGSFFESDISKKIERIYDNHFNNKFFYKSETTKQFNEGKQILTTIINYTIDWTVVSLESENMKHPYQEFTSTEIKQEVYYLDGRDDVMNLDKVLMVFSIEQYDNESNLIKVYETLKRKLDFKYSKNTYLAGELLTALKNPFVRDLKISEIVDYSNWIQTNFDVNSSSENSPFVTD